MTVNTREALEVLMLHDEVARYISTQMEARVADIVGLVSPLNIGLDIPNNLACRTEPTTEQLVALKAKLDEFKADAGVQIRQIAEACLGGAGNVVWGEEISRMLSDKTRQDTPAEKA